MKPNGFESTLERLGRILASQYGVKVIFHEDVCAATKEAIILPVIPEDAPLDFINAVHGYLDHEVSHTLFTDFEVYDEAVAKGPLFALFLNATEDPRVERAMVSMYRGCRVNLDNCLEWSTNRISPFWENETFNAKLSKLICLQAMLEPAQRQIHWFIQKHVDAEMAGTLASIKDLTDQLDFTKSTRECAVISERIIERLQLVPDPENKSKKPGKAKECPIGTENVTLQEQIAAEARSLRANSQKNPYLIWSTANDEIELIADDCADSLTGFIQQMRPATAVIRQRLRMSLRSQAVSRWEIRQRRGRPDSSALAQLAIGTSKAVFKQKHSAPEINTVCSLYVDHSNSMSGGPLNLAAESVVVFGEALNDLGVPFEIAGYSTGHYDEGVITRNAVPESEQDVYTRWGRLWIGVYKQFDEPWFNARRRCHNMERHCKYNTYDGESVRIAAQRLMARPELRKILFVFSDGHPCPNVRSCMDAHHRYLSNVAAEIEKQIEVFAVGIQSDAVAQFWTNQVVLDNINDLSKVVIGELDRLLRRKQNAYARMAG